ncbi:MAG: VWA domain-containing protein [Acidobacteria bacterium]|nr:VWA domain-containing protein [Acidobacteriota bacterium]
MTKVKGTVVWCMVFGSLCAGLGWAATQARTGGPNMTGSEEARVSVVEVPAYVFDRDGNPVGDLEPEEFAIYEDGKRQNLELVELIDAGRQGSQWHGEATPMPPEAVAAAPIHETRRHFVLLFDMVFTDMAGIKRSREAAARFVTTRLGTGEPAAIFSFTRTAGITMHANFTTDRHRLLEALAGLGSSKQNVTMAESAGLLYRSRPGDASPGMLPDFFGGIEESLDAIPGQIKENLFQAARFDRFTYRSVVRDYLTDLRDFATSLNVLPGRKIVVLFTAGYDARLAMFNDAPSGTGDPARAATGRDSAREKPDGLVVDLATTAMSCFSASDCRLYCVEASGIQEAESDRLGGGGSEAKSRRRDSLAFFAAESGGRYFLSDNNLDRPLAEVLRETGQYYLLAYSPRTNEGKGAYHTIKVEVTRPGLSIVHRKGYYENKAFTEYTALEKDLQIAEMVVNDVRRLDGLTLEAQAFCFPIRSDATASLSQVLIQTEIPSTEFTGRADRPIEIVGFALGPHGAVLGFFRGQPRPHGAALEQRLAQGGLGFTSELLLPPGPTRVKVIVRDLKTGAIGVRDIDLHVADYRGPGPHVASPTFLSTGTQALKLRGDRGGQESDGGPDSEPEYPLRMGQTELVPSCAPVLANGRSIPLLLKLYDIHIDPRFGRPDLQVTWGIVDLHGASRGAPQCKLIRIESNGQGCADMLFDIIPPRLPAEPYRLQIGIHDNSTGDTIEGEVHFSIAP